MVEFIFADYLRFYVYLIKHNKVKINMFDFAVTHHLQGDYNNDAIYESFINSVVISNKSHYVFVLCITKISEIYVR